MTKMPLIVSRPEPGAGVTVRKARAMGLDAHACPLFAVAPLDWTPPNADSFDALMLTSANAARHAGGGLDRYAGLPVHAVGEATAEAARGAGLVVASAHTGGAQALVDALAAGSARKLLWLCGEDRIAIDPGELDIEAVAVYAARPIDPPASFAALIAAPSVALVHSVRAGQRLAALVDERAPVAIAAISGQAAEACGAGWRETAHAERPSGDAVLELAWRMCQTSVRKDAAGR